MSDIYLPDFVPGLERKIIPFPAPDDPDEGGEEMEEIEYIDEEKVALRSALAETRAAFGQWLEAVRTRTPGYVLVLFDPITYGVSLSWAPWLPAGVQVDGLLTQAIAEYQKTLAAESA